GQRALDQAQQLVEADPAEVDLAQLVGQVAAQPHERPRQVLQDQALEAPLGVVAAQLDDLPGRLGGGLGAPARLGAGRDAEVGRGAWGALRARSGASGSWCCSTASTPATTTRMASSAPARRKAGSSIMCTGSSASFWPHSAASRSPAVRSIPRSFGGVSGRGP